MPTLQIIDLPQDTYDKLADIAQAHGRSLIQQAVVCLKIGLENEIQVNAKQKALERINQLRGEIKNKMTIEEIVNMIREDRDR